MAQLSLDLPPFAPDYSGAGAVFFDLNCITVMHDGGGCTGNYTGHDEPRWYGSRAEVFSSALRMIDVVMGDDEKLEQKMLQAAKDLHPDMMAVIGSPVPMIIGTDIEGIAAELEERSGLPCFGIDTTGIGLYGDGAYEASVKLMERFALPVPVVANRVNILGATPLDFTLGEDIDALQRTLEANGYTVGLRMAMGYTLEDIRQTAAAELNLAVSGFGLKLARYLNDRFGTPYVCGLPLGETAVKEYLTLLDKKQTAYVNAGDEALQSSAGQYALILGEPVMAASMRHALLQNGRFDRIGIVSFYGLDDALSLSGDRNLTKEREIRSLLHTAEYDLVIADPMLRALMPEDRRHLLKPFAQYAVSSGEGIADFASVFGTGFDSWFAKSA